MYSSEVRGGGEGEVGEGRGIGGREGSGRVQRSRFEG